MFTMGNFYDIHDRSAELLSLYEELFVESPIINTSHSASEVVLDIGPGNQYDTDAALVKAISESDQGRKFQDLYVHKNLSYYGEDHSRADLGLCTILAYWLGGDAERVDRVFRLSALMRDKWDSKRGSSTYGKQTIGQAYEFLNKQRLESALGQTDDRGLISSGDAFAHSNRFNPIPLSDVTLEFDDAFLVDRFIYQNSTSMIYGPSGSGKTFAVLDLVLHIAAGSDWNGRATVQSDVVYIATEGGHALKKRILAARQKLTSKLDEVPFYLVVAPLDISGSSSDVQPLVESIRTVRKSSRPLLIVIDTLSRALAGADENSASEMNAMLSQVVRLQTELNSSVLLVHHTGKSSRKQERGSSALRAGVDTSLCVEADSHGNRKIKVNKQRDLEDDLSFPFRLEPVNLVVEGSTELIQTCVVRPGRMSLTEVNSSAGGTDRRCNDLKGSAKLAFNVIQECLAKQAGSDVLNPIPHDVLNGLLMEAGICKSVKPNSVQRAIKRSLHELEASNLISVTVDGVQIEPDN